MPGVETALPAGQAEKGVQAAAPALAENEPAAHGRHAAAAVPPGEYVPAGQAAHTVLDAVVQADATTLPAAHGVQLTHADWPALGAYVLPATQAVQLVAPEAADVPAGQIAKTALALAEQALTRL